MNRKIEKLFGLFAIARSENEDDFFCWYQHGSIKIQVGNWERRLFVELDIDSAIKDLQDIIKGRQL